MYTEPNFPSRVQVVGLRIDSDSQIKPEGYHLRWFVPKEYGYPDKGFELFYLNKEKYYQCDKKNINFTKTLYGEDTWSKRTREIKLDEVVSLILDGKEKFQIEEHGLRVENRGDKDHVLITFSEPAIMVSLQFLPIKNKKILHEFYKHKKTNKLSNINVFYGNTRIGTYKIVDNEVLIQHANITTLLISKQALYFTRLTYTLEKDIVKCIDKHNIHYITIPSDEKDAYSRINKDSQFSISNYLLPKCHDIQDFKTIYKKEKVKNLISKENETINNVDLTEYLENQHGINGQDISVFQFLQFASLNPNIARLMGLYWIDTDTNRFNKAGIYIIRGQYGNKSIYGFHIKKDIKDLPQLNEYLNLKQLPGITYDGRIPLGRIELTWEKPEKKYYDSSNPIFLELIKYTDGSPSDPIIKAINSDKIFKHTETEIAIGKDIYYEVAPIDLFGRKGKTKNSKKISLTDLDNPIPPKNIKASVIQNGFPWQNPYLLSGIEVNKGKIDIAFEYGDSQHKMSPDAQGAQLYWSLEEDESSNYPNRILLSGNKYDIKWKKLGGKVDLTKHIIEKQVQFSYEEPSLSFEFSVKEIRKIQSGEIKDSYQLNRLEPNLIKRDKLPDSDRFELLIDHALSEPDAFVDYEFKYGRNTYTVIESRAGISYSDDIDSEKRRTARFIVKGNLENEKGIDKKIILHSQYADPNKSCDSNTNCVVKIGLKLNDTEKEKLTSNYGDFAIDFTHIINKDENIPHNTIITPVDFDEPLTDRKLTTFVGRLICEPISNSELTLDEEKTYFYVRLKPKDFQQLCTVIMGSEKRRFTTRYYLPFHYSFSLGINTDADINIDLEGKPYRKIWFSASVTDDGGKKSIQLANPFENQVVAPPVIVKPDKPTICDATNVGYVSVPNHDGFSRVCLKLTKEETPSCRYDIARASASSIITIDKQNWLQGKNTEHLNPVNVTLIFKSIDDGESIYKISKDSIPNYAGENSLTGGVVKQGDVYMSIVSDKIDDDYIHVDGLNEINSIDEYIELKLSSVNDIKLDEGDAQLYTIPVFTSTVLEVTSAFSEIRKLDNGTINIPIQDSSDNSSFEEIKRNIKGRVSCQFSGDLNKTYFQLLNVLVLKNNENTELQLICKPFFTIDDDTINNQNTILNCTINIEALPDYSLVNKNDEALISLADVVDEDGIPKNIDAFGMVSKMPVKSNKFIDESIIGIGKSRYFYKIRSVGNSHSVSQWSDCSVPVYQLDLFKPEPPANLKALANIDKIELVWDVQKNDDFESIEIYRYEDDIDSAALLEQKNRPFSYKPLRALNGILLLPKKLEYDPTDGVHIYIRGGDIDLFVKEKTILEDRKIKNINPLVPDNQTVTIVLNDNSEIKYRPGSNKEPLKTFEQNIDLSFYISDIVSIEAIYQAFMVPENANINEIMAPNLLEDTSFTPVIDLDNLIISNFGEENESLPVLVVVKKTDDSLMAVRYQPGTDKPLTVKEGIVALNLDIAFENIKSIMLNDEFYLQNHWDKVSIMLTEASTIKPGDGFVSAIENINPLISNGIDLKIDIDSVFMDSDNRYYFYSDEDNLNFEKEYQYFLKYIKKTNISIDKTITLESEKSNVASAKLTDYRVPSPPQITGASLENTEDDDDTNDKLALTITTDEITAAVVVEYKYGDENEWRKIKLNENSYWKDSNSFDHVKILYRNKDLFLRSIAKTDNNKYSNYSNTFKVEYHDN